MNMHKEILQKAIDTYGETSQKIMLFEEMAELQKEVSKSLRGEDNHYQIMEELADVYIMLEQLKMMHGICDEALQEFVHKKVERLKKRLDNARD